MLRAAISIPSNIADGAGRGSKPGFSRSLWHSMGSCNELESQLLLAQDLRFVPRDQFVRLTEDVAEVRRMLTSFIDKLK